MGWSKTTQGLAGLEPAARVRLERHVPRELPVGAVLFRPGDAVQGYVIVLSGRVAVRLAGSGGRDLLLYAVEPGQACVQSTLGLLGGNAHYSAEAVCEAASRIVLLPRGDFLALLDDSPAFRTLVFAAFAERMQTMMRLLEKLTFQRIEARLAQTLLQEAGPDGTVAASHQDLACRIGTAREVVSRRLEALARRGVVQLDRRLVTLTDRHVLRALADEGEM